MNISDIVKKNAERVPDWPAVISESQEMTWGIFHQKINKLGNALRRLGVQKGDRVAIYLPNSPEFLIAYFAIIRISAIAVPFNIMYKTTEITYIVNDSEAGVMIAASKEAEENVINSRDKLPTLKHLIVTGEHPVEDAYLFSELLARESDNLETVNCAPDDIATILYTSGTTGNPKGAMLTHSNYWEQSELNGCYILHISDQDRILTAAPYCHIFFVTTVLGPMFKGAAVVTMPRFYPEKALQMISDFQVTHFAGVPTMYIYMLRHFQENPTSYDFKSWRVAQSAGAAMPAELIPQIEENFGVHYCECYGATETCAACTYERVGHARAGSIGVAAHSWQVKIVNENNEEVPLGEVGEILVKGPGVFKSYWKKPEATAAAFSNGWFHTGDLAYANSDGYFFIVDRKKDMIICGGYNVYPREIEELLFTHPDVLEVAVIGVRDIEKGEVPKAFIILKPDAKVAEEELISFCKKNLAAYKAPRVIEICNNLPKTPTGKILKRELK